MAMSREGKAARAEAAASHHIAQVSGSDRADAMRKLKETQAATKQISLEYAMPTIPDNTDTAIGMVLEIKRSFWEGLEEDDPRRQRQYRCKVLR